MLVSPPCLRSPTRESRVESRYTTEMRRSASIKAQVDNICPKCRRAIHCNPGSFRTHLRYCGAKETLFWAKVDKSGGANSCWLWTARTLNRSYHKYGRFDKSGPMAYAHRVAWILSSGPIPDGMHVLHKCDVPQCCNPKHLWLGTHDDNMADAARKRRMYRGGNRPPHIAFPDRFTGDEERK